MLRANTTPETAQTLAKPAVMAVAGGAAEAWLNAPTLPHFETTAEIRLPVLEGFEILRELGRGGMGVVYQARELSTNTIVAIKFLLAGNHASQIERERFRREMLAASVLRHPNVIQLLAGGEQQGLPYLVLEYVSGGSLADRLNGTPWSPVEAAKLVRLLANTVQFAHDQGVLHRDLKPANILFSEDTPKLADFGLAKSVDEVSNSRPVTESGAVLGTPSYISPEQATAEHPVGPSTDVYSLGAILYELTTGRPPFEGKNTLDIVLKVMKDPPILPIRFVPNLPESLSAIILKCLHKDPEQRYGSAAELADDLGRFLVGEPVLAQPMTVTSRLFSWFTSRPRATMAASSTAMLVFAFLAWFGIGSNGDNAKATAEQTVKVTTVAKPKANAAIVIPRLNAQKPIVIANDPKLAELLARYQELNKLLELLRDKSKADKEQATISTPPKSSQNEANDGQQTEKSNPQPRGIFIPFLRSVCPRS
jgi:serine/threonine protein kinase